ncbi:glycosyltransferase family 2 protein [Leeuwenhoekiella sp.]|uniref:glycosyltransferase family 2 protein n=1 Tax=Leeuwenhoekiella sp. TaxID=1977054 RepID=UPI000C5325C9|nr:glycosyltransferase family 2 protein [Leeuwenhoekiella sp.]MBA82974.1 hypothetical protein [Leeuwenhoekiella sp.]
MPTDIPLVSIIIPTYNRAHLIGETLDSVLAQTYKNWECIVVDDGSTDNTSEVVKSYLVMDSRFQYHHRPKDRLPGGNAARNYGFELSKGEYIQWFDSDDLMVAEKLELKVAVLMKNNVDFVISKTKYFNKKNGNFKNYDFEAKDVTFEMFATDYIKWITNDMILKHSIAKQISFNEHLRAGQEHNFICQLLLKSTNLFYVKEFLSLKRYTVTSIQGKRDMDKLHHFQIIGDFHWLNYLQLFKQANSQKFNKFSLLQPGGAYLASKNKIRIPSGYWIEFLKVYKGKSIYLLLAIISNKVFGRYKRFYKKLK